jgi:hypothetical protein
LAGNANGQSKPAGWLARLGMAASIALAIWFLPEFWVWAWPYRYGAKDAVWFMRALLLVGLGISLLFRLLGINVMLSTKPRQFALFPRPAC